MTWVTESISDSSASLKGGELFDVFVDSFFDKNEFLVLGLLEVLRAVTCGLVLV